MKDKFTRCYQSPFYVREVKKSWLHRWEIERIGLFPVLYKYTMGKFVKA